MTETLADFLGALRVARDRAGLSGVEAARRAGMQQANWSKLESGRTTDPRLSTLEAAAKGVGMRLHLGLVEDPADVMIVTGKPADTAEVLVQRFTREELGELVREVEARLAKGGQAR